MAVEDIYRAYNFKLDFQGEAAAYFTEVVGMGVSVETIEYRAGGDALGVRKLPGRVSVEPITLRYGLTRSMYLWNWLTTAVQGKVERRDVSIILLANDGVTEVTRWNLGNTWVSALRGAMLNATNQEVAIESVTLQAETLERADGGGAAQAAAAA